MPQQVEAIQILLKTKMAGEDALGKAIERVNQLGKSIANYKPMDAVQASLEKTTKKAREVSQNIQNINEETNKKIEGRTEKTANTISGALKKSVDPFIYINAMFPILEKMFLKFLPNIGKAYDYFINIATGMKNLSVSFVNIVQSSTTLSWIASAVFASLSRGFILFSFVDTVKEIVGTAKTSVPIIDKIKNAVKMIDTWMNDMTVSSKSIIRPFSTGIVTIVGSVAGLLTPLMTAIGGLTSFLGLANLFFFSSGIMKAKFLFSEIGGLIKGFLDTILSKFYSINDIGLKFKQQFSTELNQEKQFSREINGLSSIKFPIAGQIQLIIAEVRPFLDYAIRQLSSITDALFFGFNLSKRDIQYINDSAKKVLGGVQSEASKSFGFVHKEFQNAFDMTVFSRVLHTWWNNSFIAGMVRMPLNFAKWITGGIYSGIKALTTKAPPIEKEKQDFQIEEKKDDKALTLLKTVRQFGKETTQIINENVVVIINSIDTVTKKLAEKIPEVKKLSPTAISPAIQPSKKGGGEDSYVSLLDIAKEKEVSNVAQLFNGLVKKLESNGIDAGKNFVSGVNKGIETQEENPKVFQLSRLIQKISALMKQVKPFESFQLLPKGEAVDKLKDELNDLVVAFVLLAQKKVTVREVFQTIQKGFSALSTISKDEKILGNITESKIEEKLLSPSGLSVFQKLLSGVAKEIQELQNTKKIGTQDFSQSFVDILIGDVSGVGFTRAKNRIVNLIGSLLTDISFPKQYYPYGKEIIEKTVQDIDLSKPLARKGGMGIVKEISTGVVANIPALTKAMDKATEAADKFLPHSPAEEGAFKTLREAGAKILDELSFGISSKVAWFLGIFHRLSNNAVVAMKPMLEVGNVAKRIGIAVTTLSSLQYAFVGFDVSATDLQTTFTSLSKSINEVATVEKQAALANVGINLSKVRSATSPATEMFLQFSDAMKKFPPNSEAMQKALEAIGLSTQSNIVNAMMMGRERILEMMNEGAKVGATFDQSFVSIGQSFTETMNKFGKIGEYLERDFLQIIIGPLKDTAEYLFSFYSNNVVAIRAIIKIAGEVFNILLDMIGKFSKRAINDPQKGIEFLGSIVMGFWQSMLTMGGVVVDDFLEGTLGKIWQWLKAGWNIVWGVLSEYAYQIGDLIARQARIWTQTIKIKFLEMLASIVSSPQFRLILDQFGILEKTVGAGLKQSIISEKTELDKILEEEVNAFGGAGGDFSLESVFGARMLAVAERTKKIIAESKEELGRASSVLADPKKWEETATKFKAGFVKAIEDFKTITGNTGWGDIFSDAMTKFNQAVSKQNWDEAAKQMQDMSDKAQGAVNKIAQIGPEARKAAEQAKNATKIIADDIIEKVTGLTKAQREQAIVENKIAVQTLQVKLKAASDETEKKAIQRELDIQNMIASQEDELKNFKIALDAKYTEERDYEEKVKALKGFVAQQKMAITANLNDSEAQKEIKLFNEKTDVATKFTSNFQTLFSNMYELTGKKVKAFFYLEKAASIAEAIINTATGIVNAFALPAPLNLTLGPVLAELVATVGATQVGIITSQAIQGPSGYAAGGIVPGNGDGDIVPAMLTPGEAIIRKGAVQKYGTVFLNALNEGLLPERVIENLSLSLPTPMPRPQMAFANGGLVMPMSAQQSNRQEINITNVTSREEIFKAMNSASGRDVIFNVLSSENNKFRKIVRGV